MHLGGVFEAEHDGCAFGDVDRFVASVQGFGHLIAELQLVDGDVAYLDAEACLKFTHLGGELLPQGGVELFFVVNRLLDGAAGQPVGDERPEESGEVLVDRISSREVGNGVVEIWANPERSSTFHDTVATDSFEFEVSGHFHHRDVVFRQSPFPREGEVISVAVDNVWIFGGQHAAQAVDSYEHTGAAVLHHVAVFDGQEAHEPRGGTSDATKDREQLMLEEYPERLAADDVADNRHHHRRGEKHDATHGAFPWDVTVV